jgi:hypothetical protein
MGGARREFQTSRTKFQHGILLTVMLALVGLWALLFAGSSVRDAEWVGAIALAMSAVMLFVALRNARDTSARMVLEGDGIWFRDWQIGLVPWAAFDDVYTSGTRVQAFASLHLRDPDGFLADLPEAERKALRGNRLMKAPELRIPHGVLDATLDEIVTAVKAHLDTPQA